MHESTLRDFFLGKTDAKTLAKDIEGSRVVKSKPGHIPEVSRNYIVDMDSEFAVSRSNLVAVCDAHLAGDLKAGDVQFIGYALACSDNFTWDGDQDNTLASIIEHWSSPETNYPLNIGEHPALSPMARGGRGVSGWGRNGLVKPNCRLCAPVGTSKNGALRVSYIAAR